MAWVTAPQGTQSSHSSSSLPRLPLLILPITRAELPGWGKLGQLFHITGAVNDPNWHGAPHRTIRGKWHRYLMDLDLADWSERQTYFLGRYCDLETQLLLDAALRPGDRVVDVGGNVGMITLHAAALVGPGGLVETFEPNPACCRRIFAALERNRIGHVRLHGVGLSDTPATLTLTLLSDHSGMATLAPVDPGQAEMIRGSVTVPVVAADSVLLAQDRPITFVKIDVEGFETRALRGMTKVLNRWRPVVTTEVLGEWLERAGSSTAELFDFMASLGYRPFGMRTVRRALRHRLALRPVQHPQDAPPGVAWVPDDSPLRARLGPLLDQPNP